jgi:hypothetical protein
LRLVIRSVWVSVVEPSAPSGQKLRALLWRKFERRAEQLNGRFVGRTADASLDGGDGSGAQSRPLGKLLLGEASPPAGAPQDIGKAQLRVSVMRRTHLGRLRWVDESSLLSCPIVARAARPVKRDASHADNRATLRRAETVT